MCLQLEKSAIYGSLENFKEEKEMEYKKLKSKEISQKQEKALEEEINKKLGGIDAILKKANQANPALFQGDAEKAQKETQELVSNMKEENKQQEEYAYNAEAEVILFVDNREKRSNSDINYFYDRFGLFCQFVFCFNLRPISPFEII